jgi:hypothetical protein
VARQSFFAQPYRTEHFLSSIYTGCILEFLEKVTKEVDSGKPFDVIFRDFAKAFDKVL